MPIRKDGFFSQVDKFFKRVQNKDLIKLSSNSIDVFSAPQSKDEAKTKRELQVFKQYLQSKNWNLKHIELFDEYRRMDATFPLLNAALRLYSQEICYSLDTRIAMLDGSTRTLKELIDLNAKDFWIWGYDNENKKIVPVKCDKAISKGFKEVVTITLDDGSILKCTPNHKHLLKSGEWKEAKDLKEGDSLRSIYEKIDENGYLKLTDGEVSKRDHKKIKYKYAHSIVANEVDFLKEQKKNLSNNKYEKNKSNMPVCHHASFDKLNNDPNFLQWLSWGDHQKIHSNSGFQKKRWNEDEDFRDKMLNSIRESAKKFWNNIEKAKARASHHSKVLKERIAMMSIDERKNKYGISRERHNWRKEVRGSTLGSKNPHAYENKNHFEDFSIEYLDEQIKDCGTKEYFYKKLNCTNETLKKYMKAKNTHYYDSLIYPRLIPIVEDLIRENVINYTSNIGEVLKEREICFGFSARNFGIYIKKLGYKSIKEFIDRSKKEQEIVLPEMCDKKNHKVVSVEFTKEVLEVGDVVNAGNVHNFAIKCNKGQIIVHNCISGDSIVTLPEGDRTVRELYDKKRDLFIVQSYDAKNNRVSWNECHGIVSNGIKTVYEITVQRNITKEMAGWDTIKEAKFKCTDNHKIYIGGDKYKEVSELKIGDVIFAYYRDVDPSCKCKVDRFVSTIILDIKEVGTEEVFDLINVTPVPHFSLKLTDSFYVVVHNCSKDTDGNIIKVVSEDLPIKKALEECYFKNLKLNTRGYLITKSLLKFGNLFGYLNTRRGVGVTDLIYLPPESMRIHLLENSERLDEFKYHWWGYGSGLQFDPWEIVHWKIIEDLESEPYGQSILRSIVDTWRRIVLMREALIIYRITRAPQRYLFKIDTTGLDPDAALAYADEMRKSLMKKPLQNPTTGEVDFKYNVMPADKDTPVPLLDGRTITIEQAAKEFDEGKQNYVYSVQDKTHQIVPGKIKWCGKNYTANKLIKVWTVDEDGKECYAMTAPEHPFMLRDGSKKRADELKEGDSLMPLYSKLKSIAKKGNTYEQVFNPATDKYEYTHRLIGKEVAGKTKYNNTIHHVNYDRYCNTPDNLKWMNYRDHFIFHSINNKERNSTLAMLEAMKKSENKLKQKEKASEFLKEYWKNNKDIRINNRTVHFNDFIFDYLKSLIVNSDILCLKDIIDHCKNDARFIKEFSRINENYEEELNLTSTIINERLKENGFSDFYDFKSKVLNSDERTCKKNSYYKLVADKNRIKHQNGELSFFGKLNPNYKGLPSKIELLNALDNSNFIFNCFRDVKRYINEMFPNHKKSFYLYELCDKLVMKESEFVERYISYKRSNEIGKIAKRELVKNHKVIKVEVLENQSRDVYCMTIVGLSEEDDRHNFAIGGYDKDEKMISHNVFIFNSIQDDFYMPTAVDRADDISVIEGANNMDQVEDYKIIKDDIYSGLLIPNAFLNMETDLCLRSNTSVLTNNGTISIKRIYDLLHKEKSGKIYVLSCNKHGLITTGKVLDCMMTKEVNSFHKIYLSNNSFVECTENHPFLLADEMKYLRADELSIGDKIKNKNQHDIFVTKIEIINLEEKEWVYDLNVEEHHNFCLGNDIFVHNSNKAALSQEDLRFSNAVRQYQSYFVEGLLHIGLVHLYLNGFGKDELESFEIQMNNNSTLAEKNKNELLQQRFDLAHSALDTSNGGIALMSYIDVLKNVLKFSDEEVAKTFKNQMIEKKLIWRLNQLAEQGFYEEPDPDKKKAIMKGLGDTDEDVFKELQFESLDNNLSSVREVLTEKVEKEISFLTQSVNGKPSKKQIDMIVELNTNKLKKNTNKTIKDMGLSKNIIPD